MRRVLYLLAPLAVGCATAGSSDIHVGDDVVDPDSMPGTIDARPIDGMPLPIDAMPIDAIPIDAAPTCTVQTVQILLNPAFDGAPQGSSWVTFPFNATFPMIDNLAEAEIGPQSAPYAAWLGGYPTTSSDRMYQDVAIPASTTALTLTGSRYLFTDETGSTVYDTAALQVRNTSDGVLATLASWSNVNPTTSWQAFSYNVGSYAGQTIRIHLSSASDVSNQTSFLFDSLVLNVSACF